MSKDVQLFNTRVKKYVLKYMKDTDGGLPNLDAKGTDALCIFVQHYLDASQKALDELTTVPLRPRPLYLSDSIAYWRGVRGGLRWLLAEVKRRKGK